MSSRLSKLPVHMNVLNSPRKIKSATTSSSKKLANTSTTGNKVFSSAKNTSLKRKLQSATTSSAKKLASTSTTGNKVFSSAKNTSLKRKNVDSTRGRIQYPPPPAPLSKPPSKIEVLRDENSKLKKQFDELRKEYDEIITESKQLQNEIQEEECARKEYIKDIDRMKKRVANEEAHVKEIEDYIANLQQNRNDMIKNNSKLASEMKAYRCELEIANENITNQSENITNNINQIQEFTSKLQEYERLRRKLHNDVQDLKGNIRVFCRARPLLDSESQNIANFKFPKEIPFNRKISLMSTKTNYLGEKKEIFKEYQFDQVFDTFATQKDIFSEVAHIVQSVVDGYNGCIFAYGQTGAGKTYTMTGPTNATPETEGMIPRAVRLIYDIIQDLKTQCWRFTLEGQFIEIYNDNIRDLLVADPSSTNGVKHKTIHDERTGTTRISKATTVDLDCPNTLNQALKTAAHNRAVAATKCNAHSSRSHSVFMIRLRGTNDNSNETRIGSLNLIDLAGSERLSKSESKGDQLQEAKHINSSLSHLKTVIQGIKKDSCHINFRDSSLTWLLKNSLGGNAKVLMLVNISPLESLHYYVAWV
ncbi:kinesin-domain-containing protein [Gigaspora margarita]|uniref:Kinesin-like protein n=1 Tax=Gigaspora margarita TaxID=4874 RepID=A0A8H4A0G7_GIGMA|nr:kinesin-domain-containing protein [Gigaspora margarita]